MIATYLAEDTKIGGLIDNEDEYLNLQQDLDQLEGGPRNGKYNLTDNVVCHTRTGFTQ